MIWFLGDVHGRFDRVIRLLKLHRPDAVVFLGDLECSLPLDMILRPILDLTEVCFIHGNHDSDRPAFWHNLPATAWRIAACMGGSLRSLVIVSPAWGERSNPWHGRPGTPDTGVQSYKNFFERLALRPQHADIVSTKKQHALSANYPDDFFSLAMEKADILVCHEAPSCQAR